MLILLRRDIFLVTENNTGYIFDTNLVLRQAPIDLEQFIKLGTFDSITSIGLHSNFIVIGDNGGELRLINLSAQQEIAKVFKHPSSKQDMITQVSMNSKVILAGTEKGFTGIWDYNCSLRFNFNAGEYVHSVSVHDYKLLVGAGDRIYIWMDYNNPNKRVVHEEKNLVWAAFHPFRPSPTFQCSDPNILWNDCKGHKYRPMIRERYGPNDREYYLVTRQHPQCIEIRDFKSEELLQIITIKDEPEMAWTNQEHLFLIYGELNTIESIPLSIPKSAFEVESTREATYYESTSLVTTWH